MAAKTANVLARVEPEVKQQAEEIMSQLGIPVSVVINMLYKQIIMKKGIPFSLSLPHVPVARDEMDASTFDRVMEQGLSQAKSGESVDARDALDLLRREILNG